MMMRTVLVSYSLTGNNDALAASIAAELGSEHIRIVEPRVRTLGMIALDRLFGRTPKVSPAAGRTDGYDLVLLVGPVWMGRVAAPLRANLRHLRRSAGRYAFVSVSGGADGPNLGVAGDLTKRTKRAPAAVIDLQIVDLLPRDPKPTRQDTEDYRVTQKDVKRMTEIVVEKLRDAGIVEGVDARRGRTSGAASGRGSP
jgi:hypothetical protein